MTKSESVDYSCLVRYLRSSYLVSWRGLRVDSWMVALLVLARSHPGNQIRLLSSRATKIQSCSIANLESCNLTSLSSSILSSTLPSAFLLLFLLLTSDPLFRHQPIRSALCLFPYVDIVLVCSGLFFNFIISNR